MDITCKIDKTICKRNTCDIHKDDAHKITLIKDEFLISAFLEFIFYVVILFYVENSSVY